MKKEENLEIGTLSQIFYLLADAKNKVLFLIFLFLINSSFDLMGLGLIAAYISAMIDVSNQYSLAAQQFLNNLGYSVSEADILKYLGAGLVIIFLCKALISVGLHYISIFFSFKQANILRSKLMISFQSLPYEEYLLRNSSEYITSVQTYVGHFSQVLYAYLRLASDTIVAIAIVSFLLFVNAPSLTLFAFLIGGSWFLYEKLFKQKVIDAGIETNVGARQLNQGVQEGISGLKEIRILGIESFFLDQVKKGSKKNIRNIAKKNLISIIARYFLEFVLVLFVVSFILFAPFLGLDMEEVLPTLGLFAVASLRLLPMANQVLASTIEIRFGRNGVSKVYNDIVNADNREQESHNFSEPHLKKADKKFEEIAFKNVSFKYHSSTDWILKDLDLLIKSGESVGIIGPSGAGKTTFLDVLLGLLEPQEGKIIFNQESFKESIDQWRSQVAYLPQEIFLTDSTLKSNVALGLPLEMIDEEKVCKSLSQAKLDSLVSELPNGVETLLGENGIRLSGGQRQRVALARSFYYQRNVLILDEATSSLDNETEREIVEEIKDFKAEKTLIVIAHRYSTIEHCDRIYKLDKGRIVSQGSFQEVVGKN